MKLKKVIPILWTDHFEETINFYTQILGFSIKEKNLEWQWATIYKDDAEIMLSKPNDHTPFLKPIFTGSLYFITENVEQLWNELKDKSKICYEIESFEWNMKEFAIYDNNGYILQFGQEIR